MDIRIIGQPRIGRKCKMCGKEKEYHNSYDDCFLPLKKRMGEWGIDYYIDNIERWYRGTKFV